jgi:hypothetical protein
MATFVFVLTPKSQIIDLVKSSGRVPDEKVYKEAIVKFSTLWVPARQNSHLVCVEIKLRLETTKEGIKVRVM